MYISPANSDFNSDVDSAQLLETACYYLPKGMQVDEVPGRIGSSFKSYPWTLRHCLSNQDKVNDFVTAAGNYYGTAGLCQSWCSSRWRKFWTSRLRRIAFNNSAGIKALSTLSLGRFPSEARHGSVAYCEEHAAWSVWHILQSEEHRASERRLSKFKRLYKGKFPHGLGQTSNFKRIFIPIHTYISFFLVIEVP